MATVVDTSCGFVRNDSNQRRVCQVASVQPFCLSYWLLRAQVVNDCFCCGAVGVFVNNQ